MITLVLIFSFVVTGLADCPLVPYPRSSVLGYVQAALNNDPQLHNAPVEFSYALSQPFLDGGVGVAIGIVGMQVNSRGQLDFNVVNVPTTLLTSLKFRVTANDPNYGWKLIRFNFFASQNYLFQANVQTTTQFSVGLESGKYAIYRPIPNFNIFQSQPIIKVFLSGLSLKSKPLDDEYNTMLAQYENFRKFSTNAQLVTYFQQAVQIKKSLQFKISDAKILGRLFTFMFSTNSLVQSLTFSYILFSKTALTQQHSYISDDFSIVNSNVYRFSSLQNMDMLMSGLNGFKVSRDTLYTFGIALNNLGGQSIYSTITNYQYFQVFLTFVAFDMQYPYVCQDCQDGTIIYNNNMCVKQCPRGYSIYDRNGVKFCDACNIEQLKVVDPNTGTCVCAARHYLDLGRNTCLPCSYDCMTCNQKDVCLTCDNSLLQTKRRISSNGRCDCPAIGYYDNKAAQDIVCQQCSSKCLTCNGPASHDCLACPPYKQLDSNGFCVCSNGFLEDINGNCFCPPPKILANNGVCYDPANVQCGPNKVQQFVDLTKRCVCMPGFIAVLDDCVQCGSHSNFNRNTLTCECTGKYVMINGQCQLCGVNQVYDNIYKTCQCASGTFKNDYGVCIQCPPKMALLNNSCECIFNYFEVSPGVCQRCLRDTDGPKCKRNLA